jgi:hypothetical protein
MNMNTTTITNTITNTNTNYYVTIEVINNSDNIAEISMLGYLVKAESESEAIKIATDTFYLEVEFGGEFLGSDISFSKIISCSVVEELSTDNLTFKNTSNNSIYGGIFTINYNDLKFEYTKQNILVTNPLTEISVEFGFKSVIKGSDNEYIGYELLSKNGSRILLHINF